MIMSFSHMTIAHARYSTDQHMFKIFAKLIRCSCLLLLCDPRENIVTLMDVLVQLDGLFQLGVAGRNQHLQPCQLLIQLGLECDERE